MKIPLANAIFGDNLNIDKFYKSNRSESTKLKDLTLKRLIKKYFQFIKLKSD